jgi:hypothetical protein
VKRHTVRPGKKTLTLPARTMMRLSAMELCIATMEPGVWNTVCIYFSTCQSHKNKEHQANSELI